MDTDTQFGVARRPKAKTKAPVKSERLGAMPAGPEMTTDLGNARRLVRLHGADLRFVYLWRKWIVWEDGHWRKECATLRGNDQTGRERD